LILLLAVPLAVVAQPLPWNLCNETAGNYTEKSAYEANIRRLAATLPDNTSNAPGFFATRATGTPPDVVYALALCRGDTNDTLLKTPKMTPKYFKGKHGGRVFGVRCNFRFETYPFFFGGALVQLPNPPQANTTPPATTKGTEKATRRVSAITVPLAAALVLALSTTCFCSTNRRAKERKTSGIPYSPKPDDIQSVNSLLLDLSMLRAATDNFCDSNKLGEGGFGTVYKGVMSDGQEIAVKRLSLGSTQGVQELKTELVLVAKLQHKNLVRLIGVCLEEDEKLLVYEYMPNRSLHTILFGVTHRIAGTYGYMAPEYAMRGQYSVKSDVFSLGVLILEIITGRKNSSSYANSEESFVLLMSLVWEHWTARTSKGLLDPFLSCQAPQDQILKLVNIGLLCVQDSPVNRPMISTGNVMLGSDSISLQAPSRPTFCIPEMQANLDVQSKAIASPNEVSVTEVVEPR
ncbi:hypothetical protein EJB05_32914, partial [Eragrostis curvula]